MKERKKFSKKNSQLILSKEKNIDNKDLLLSNTQLQKELVFFKNEILKDVSLLTKELSEKYENFELTLNSETSKLNSLITDSETKIKNLTNLIPLINNNQTLLDILTKFQKKTETYIITNDIRYSNFMKEYSKDISRHDNILKESIIYPGVIGPSGKFQNFHDLIDYFLKNLNDLLNYKEKNEADLIQDKNYLDNKINVIKSQMKDFIDNITHTNKKEFNKMDTKINEFSLKIDEVTKNLKLENEKNINDIIQKNKGFMEKIEEDIKNKNEENINMMNKLKKLTHKEQKESSDSSRKYISFKKQNIKNLEKKMTKESNNTSRNNTSRKNNENDSNNSLSKSKISISINKEMKNIERNLKQFIIEQLKKFSNINYNYNYNQRKSIENSRKINLSENSSFNDSIKNNKKNQKRSLSGLPKFLFKEKEKENLFENKNNSNNKRQTLVPNNLNKNIFEKFLKPEEENKNNNFGKIKEVFIEESFEGLGTHKNEKEKEKEKNKEKEKEKGNNSSILSLTEENIKSYHSSTELPVLTKEKNIKNENKKIINQRKSFDIKKNIVKKTSLLSLGSSLSFSSTKEKMRNNFNNLNKEIIKKKSIKNNEEINIKYNTLDKDLKYNRDIIIKKELVKENSTQNDIQLKSELIFNSPQNKPNPRLSNVLIAKEETQKLKLNLDKIDNDNKNKNKKYLFNSPSVYINFPKKNSIYNETVFESLHPIYRNKKFSNVISPYISLMTNNLQEMIRHYDKKYTEQRKRNLPWNRSENFLLKKENNTNPHNKENQMINQKYNYKKYKTNKNLKSNDKNDMIEFNKFRNLIMEDI